MPTDTTCNSITSPRSHTDDSSSISLRKARRVNSDVPSFRYAVTGQSSPDSGECSGGLDRTQPFSPTRILQPSASVWTGSSWYTPSSRQ